MAGAKATLGGPRRSFLCSLRPALTGTTWFALSSPAGLPPALVERLNAEVRRAMQTPAVKVRLALETKETFSYDAAAFSRYLESEIERRTPAVR